MIKLRWIAFQHISISHLVCEGELANKTLSSYSFASAYVDTHTHTHTDILYPDISIPELTLCISGTYIEIIILSYLNKTGCTKDIFKGARYKLGKSDI